MNPSPSPLSLRINEIYYSIQGESSFAGQPCVFIRTTGCSLRCRWCDTSYSFYEGNTLSFEQILKQVQKYDCHLVEVTGGEPLDQKNTIPLLKALCDLGYTALLETGGHRSIHEVDSRVRRIVDMKCPSSLMSKRNCLENLNLVTPQDEVKFVIANREDYEWSRSIVKQYDLARKSHAVFSPVYEELPPKVLAEWILEDHLPVRFQLQLHKSLWGEKEGV